MTGRLHHLRCVLRGIRVAGYLHAVKNTEITASCPKEETVY